MRLRPYSPVAWCFPLVPVECVKCGYRFWLCRMWHWAYREWIYAGDDAVCRRCAPSRLIAETILNQSKNREGGRDPKPTPPPPVLG